MYYFENDLYYIFFKDKIERKRGILESLISLRESSNELMSSTAIVSKITHLEEEWKEKCEPVIENYKQMKVASTGLLLINGFYTCTQLFIYFFYFSEVCYTTYV